MVCGIFSIYSPFNTTQCLKLTAKERFYEKHKNNSHTFLQGVDKTACKARKLSAKELKEMAGKHMDKAGAYAVQDNDDQFIEKMKGSRTNVVGFPVELFQKMFKEFSK